MRMMRMEMKMTGMRMARMRMRMGTAGCLGR